MPAHHLSFRPIGLFALAAGLSLLLWTEPARAQPPPPLGPGQSAPMPAAQCPAGARDCYLQATFAGEPLPGTDVRCVVAIGCEYGERTYRPGGYLFQMLRVCGANCTVQYWISNRPDGKSLLNIEPVRGGGIIAIGQAERPREVSHPAVRTVFPSYGSSDPACCPSQFKDITYTWDEGSSSLVQSNVREIPAGEFGGWDAMRQQLANEQFEEVFPGS